MELHFLENRKNCGYVTFGMVWEKGQVGKDTDFELCADGKRLEVESRPAAFYPEGSLKWTRHTAYIPEGTKNITLEPACEKVESERDGILVEEDEKSITVDTGRLRMEFPKIGTDIIRFIELEGTKIASGAEEICLMEVHKKEDNCCMKKEIQYTGFIETAKVEERGKLKTVICIRGSHRNDKSKKTLLPYILRFTLYNQDTACHIMHTFLYDGDEKKDFLKGIGLRFTSKLTGAPYNRHVKLAKDQGYFHETSQLLLSWKPRIHEELYKQQMDGEMLVLDKKTNKEEYEALKDITTWSNYRLYQDSAAHYFIKKRTGKECCSFIRAMDGVRSGGLVCAGGENGGLILGLKHFWQKYPSSLWIDKLEQEETALTAWIWSPEAEVMDYRHYDTEGHASAYYEGFHEVGASAYGIANTNEMLLVPYAGSIPSDEQMDQWEQQLNSPALLIADSKYYHQVGAFGPWSLPSKKTKKKIWMEEQLKRAVEFYYKEIEVRNWYGLYNYGDVMHTYDGTRHCWRYDMGGYAWQNTELVPTLWLWYAFLRSGDEKIFTMAEAMSRHCADVDVYHIGDYKGIGSRHNVIHWGCSCKEPRIAMAGHHRIYYYLTGDPRIADVFEEVKDGDYATLTIDPLRYFYKKEDMVYPTHARTGPDWSTYTSNWLTWWERTEDNTYRDKIKIGISDIKKAPLRLSSGSDFEYDPFTSHLRYIGENAAGGAHLTICMGGPQTWFELAQILEDEDWKKMIADYGVFYFDTPFSYPYMAAAMGAYAASYYKDKDLASKVWDAIFSSLQENGAPGELKGHRLTPYLKQEYYEEWPWVSTNFISQWCLNTIFCLELIGDELPEK